MRKAIFSFFIVMIGVITCVLPAKTEPAKESKTMISEGKKVSFYYTLTVDGEKVDSSEKRGPLEYTQGKGQIIKGLERELEGLKVGDTKNVVVSPGDGYGEVNQEAFKEIPKSQLPTDAPLEVGQVLSMQAPGRGVFPVVISEVKKETVILNLNHPLAGKELNFNVTIVSIQ